MTEAISVVVFLTKLTKVYFSYKLPHQRFKEYSLSELKSESNLFVWKSTFCQKCGRYSFNKIHDVTTLTKAQTITRADVQQQITLISEKGLVTAGTTP